MVEKSKFKEIILSTPLEYPQQFYLLNKHNPAEAYSIVIDQTEEDVITIREIEQRLVKYVGPIEITDTYSAPNINPDEVFSYFKGLFPLYFTPRTEIKLKFDESFPSSPSGKTREDLTIRLPNKINCVQLYQEVSEKILLDSTMFYLQLKQGDKFIKLSRNNPQIKVEYKKDDTLIVKPLRPGNITVILTNSNSSDLPVKIGEKTTVDELKEIIDIMHKIPSDRIKLVFQSETLAGGKVLTTIGVKEGSRIQYMKSAQPNQETGGTLNFVDPDVAEKQIIQFSKTAPEWRLASSGLCLEGICNNNSCVAFGCWVIMNKGFGLFNAIDNRLTNRCPKCNKIVPFATCGFNNCNYEFIGTRFEEGERVNENSSNEVGNEYLRYDPTEKTVEIDGKQKKTVVEWATLKIITRKLGDIGNNCQICLKPVLSDPWRLPCNHHLHSQCRNPNINCIVCLSNNS
mgnify:CR=1 FL=1